MKIRFPNAGSGAGISMRAAINALLKWRKTERAQTARRKKNVPQITSRWDYRPRKRGRTNPTLDWAGSETAETLSSSARAGEANNVSWFDFVDPEPTAEEATTEEPL
jgi:hypothetical protein